ncbi:hypothetical protein RND81_12G132900 [Saponaria officinalis]|uniref:Uncharacterized protein n=1 Tax=Saponaria officinalis TaxID=3572 RepID=A0AAW1H9Z8_SAPOF
MCKDSRTVAGAAATEIELARRLKGFSFKEIGFHRIWVFLVIMFQVLTIKVLVRGKLNMNTFKILLSIGPTFVQMKLAVWVFSLCFGAYTTARGMAISRLVIKFFWWCICFVPVANFFV